MKIFKTKDILPKFKGEILDITKEEIKELLSKDFNDNIDEVAFIPKVNILFVIYDEYSRSRVIYLNKENSNSLDLGTLTLDNLDSFSLDNFKLVEIRNEDFSSIAEGVEVISKIVIDNKGE